jgi:phage tail sheath gpL-like
MISPGWVDLFIPIGADLDLDVAVDLDGSPYDLTGMTGELIAQDPDAATPVLSLTDTDGLTLGDGVVTLTRTDTQTGAMSPGRYPFTFTVTDAGTTVRALEGTITTY